VSRGDEWTPNQIFWRGLNNAEPDSLVFYELAKTAEVTIDVGAHIGLYSLLAAAANPQGTIFAFEPFPRVFARLALNVEANHANNVQCLPLAAGGSEGIDRFYYIPIESLPSSAGLNPGFFESGHELVRSMHVPVTSLDYFCRLRKVDRVDLVKMDTESTEPAVLSGMRSILEASQPHILCEVLDSTRTAGEIESALRPYGYRYFHLTPNGPVRRDQVAGHASWRNYLFVARAITTADTDFSSTLRSLDLA
jgi:FkbM family methyltransferase